MSVTMPGKAPVIKRLLHNRTFSCVVRSALHRTAAGCVSPQAFLQ